MSLTSPPNLGNIVTDPVVRKVIYAVFVLAGLVIGATQVAYASIEGAGQPTWLTAALAVYAFLSIPIGSLALANAPTEAQVVPFAQALSVQGELGYTDAGERGGETDSSERADISRKLAGSDSSLENPADHRAP